jgi:hypothetical protein
VPDFERRRRGRKRLSYEPPRGDMGFVHRSHLITRLIAPTNSHPRNRSVSSVSRWQRAKAKTDIARCSGDVSAAYRRTDER